MEQIGTFAVDRVYFHVTTRPHAPRRMWHAAAYGDVQAWTVAVCSFEPGRKGNVETADRLPPTAHLCGNCSRIIAARTDIEEPVDVYGKVTGVLAQAASDQAWNAVLRQEDVPEPVASEQDDSGIAPV